LWTQGNHFPPSLVKEIRQVKLDMTEQERLYDV
jgi:hypothetical protein